MSAPSGGEWFSDEDFWAATHCFLFSEDRLASGCEEVQDVLSLTGCEQGRVVDLACGPGRHSVPLVQRGLAVTAVDRSALLLDKARVFAEAQSAAVEFVQSDMREFVRPGGYDLALSLFTSFGYFDAAEDNQRVLENVFTSLRPGGTFILDVIGKEVLARCFRPTDSHELSGGGLLVQRRRVLDDWGRIECDWILIRDGRAREFQFRHWLYSAAELRAMLAAAGFPDIRLYGSLKAVPYGPQADRLVAVARRDG